MIFCLEDDKDIRELMTYTLKQAGFTVLGIEDGTEFFKALKENIPELIVLDIMLPQEDGLSILKKLKNNNQYKDIPVIIASAKTSEFDKIKGLDLGADDYLAKPFGMMELVSRVKAVLRRCNKSINQDVIEIGNLKIDQRSHVVSINNQEIALTYKEYQLLLTFISSPNRVFTRDQLFDSVWGYDYMGESRTVDVHIGTLRDKLKEYGKYIKTIRSVGYRWNYEEKNI